MVASKNKRGIVTPDLGWIYPKNNRLLNSTIQLLAEFNLSTPHFSISTSEKSTTARENPSTRPFFHKVDYVESDGEVRFGDLEGCNTV